MRVTARGQIDIEGGLTYDISAQGRLSLADAARLLASETQAHGLADFAARIEGKQSAFKITGNVRSEEAEAMGARVRGARIDDISIESDGGPISFSTRSAAANSAVAGGAEITGIAATGLHGTIRDGKAQANLQRLAVANVKTADARATSIALDGTNAVLDNQHYQATGSLSIQGGDLSGAALGPTR